MARLRTVSTEDLENFQINEETGAVYWKGRRFVTADRVKLSRWVSLALVLTALSTAVIALAALAEVARMYVDYFRFG